MLEYHLGWRDERLARVSAPAGKLLRPILCLLAAHAVGGDYRPALPAAAALELVHNFSLIHDDIQDRGTERRHRRTVWSIWGEAQGIDAGDAMLVIAQLALLRSAERGVPAHAVLRAASALNAACLRLAEGQHLDISFEGRLEVGPEDYLRMVAGKTAALLGCSLELGAIIGGADPQLSAHYRAFGTELGIAFQMEDDRLGIWGEAKKTGKPTADDVRQRKMTLPVIHALRAGSPEDVADLRRIYGGGPPSEPDVARAVAAIERSGARKHLEQAALVHHRRALEPFSAASPAEPAGSAISRLADSLLGRDR
jgi:geranylgeranyl diphosphate synthase type I